MFISNEVTNSTFKNKDDEKKIKDILNRFSHFVREIVAEGEGFGASEVPYVYPCNFIAVLDDKYIQLAIDETINLGFPAHHYLDFRGKGRPISSKVIGQMAKDELGFDISAIFLLDAGLLTMGKDELDIKLKEEALAIKDEIIDKARMKHLNLPLGFQHLSRHFPDFLSDHPDINRNVFLMMRFNEGDQYVDIARTIKNELSEYGMNVFRADDKEYADDLWENVCVYMLGSTYGLAVFEQMDDRDFNPSVALELGFMMALNKRCLIIKDKRMDKMPTDIVGKLYKEFDTYQISETLKKCIKDWASDIGISKNG